MQLKKIKLGLFPKVVIAIALGAVLGLFLPDVFIRIFKTFNVLFAQLLKFSVPLLVLGLVTPAIANLGMEWAHLSDLQGWNCAGAKLYGVNSIPATVLVARDGTILAKNLRGEAIQEKLAELLR